MVALSFAEVDYKDAGRILVSESFASWQEFLDATDRARTKPESKQSETCPTHFCGATFEGAFKLARGGWPEGRAKVMNPSTKFMQSFTAKIKKPEWFYDYEAAGQLDIARYLDGEPEVWLRQEERETEAPAVTLVLNIAASANVDNRTIEGRGVYVANLVQALDFAGLKTRVIVGGAVGKERTEKKAEFYVTVKDYGEPLDMDSLAFALIHPSMLRRITFRYWETWPTEVRELIGITQERGYGNVMELDFQGDIYFGRLHGYEYGDISDEEMEEKVKGKLLKYGVQFNEEEGSHEAKG